MTIDTTTGTDCQRSRIGRLAVATFVASIVAIAAAARLGAAPATPRQNYDALQSQPRVSARSELTSPRDISSLGRTLHLEDRLGVPTFLWLDGVTTASAQRGGTGDAIATARAIASEIAPFYGMSRADIDSAIAREAHDSGRGPRIVTFEREIEGIEVWRDRMSVLFSRDGHAIAVSGYLPPTLFGAGASKGFILGAERAIAIAATDATELPFEPTAIRDTGREAGSYRYFDLHDGDSPLTGEIRVKRVLYHMPDRLLAAYYLELEVADGGRSSHLWGYVVSAEDGALLNRTSLTQFESFTYRVWADTTSPYIPFAGPTEDFLPHPTGKPDGSFPAYVAPNLITLSSSPFSRNDPWLPAGATVSTGNNVDAYADISGNNGFDANDIRATTTATNTFDRVFDTAAEPDASANQRMASITQLLYTVNFLHDWFYDAGFDEAAGNAQRDNFGRGGVGGDPIRAEAQDTDGEVLNNADMSTPADGNSPRMQVYLFSGTATEELNLSPGGSLRYVGARFGPTTFEVSAPVTLAIDHLFPPNDVCDSIANDVNGKIALIDRGTCTFESKALRAQQAGAVGVIIANNDPELPPAMGDDPNSSGVTIPIVMISRADGNALKSTLLGGPVSASLFRFLNPRLDGTIENSIVAHEWGHYLSGRLAELGSRQAHSMGEGWSDFVALLMSVRPGDDPDGVYAIAQYATQGIASDSGYYGIRRYPYSTDMAVNPLTFKHITDGVELPAGAPVADNFLPNSEYHNAGEVWAQALWECYAALLEDSPRLAFAEAQRRMKEYLVASLKLTPPGATFTEARDAMLAVAYAADHADFQIFCAAFARRGMGVGALSPDRSSSDNAGVVESFTCGGDLTLVNATLVESAGCDLDGVVDRGETGALTLSFRNSGNVPLGHSSLTVTSRNANVSFPAGASVSIPPSNPQDVVTARLSVLLGPGATGLQVIQFDLTWDDPELVASGPKLALSTFEGNFDLQSSASASDDVEAPITAWSQRGSPAESGKWERATASVVEHYWHATDPELRSDSSLVSPPLEVAASGNLVIAFDHRFTFETDATIRWDGGVIEISTDDGATWADVGASAFPGYNGIISNSGGNPLAHRNAFTGPSPDYPEFISTTVNLGTTYSGKTVRFRFRLGADDAGGAPGWDIDNIVVSGITNTPFTARLPQTNCSRSCPSNALCMQSGRFEVTLSARDQRTGATSTGEPQQENGQFGHFALPELTGNAANPEVFVKILDGRPVNGNFWVFYGGLTDLEYTLAVVDRQTGTTKIYTKLAGSSSGGFDVGSGVTTESCAGEVDGVPASPVPPTACQLGPGGLCLGEGRFRIQVDARDPRTGATAQGNALLQSFVYGYFSLPGLTGDASNPEVFVKVLDGRPVNGHFWIFFAGLTDLEYTVTVIDSTTGAVRTYLKSAGSACGAFDTNTL